MNAERKSTSPVLPFVVIAMVVGGCSAIDPRVLDDLVRGPSAQSDAPLDEPTVARALGEALRVGIGRAVRRVSVRDGYLANERIRIQLPKELEKMATTLRRIGFSRQVDELEVAMNRAAEEAAAEAVDVFVDAISSMSITDAWGILRGHETAATQFFRQRTEDVLSGRFRPIIEHKMGQVGLARQYDRLSSIYNALPLVSRPAVDLDAYLTHRALDGLFHELAEEERKIRRDPVARTTELLRRVFEAR